MKKLLTILPVLLFFSNVHAQKFQFQLFFEDAIGNKDTITLGYDKDGTEAIDIALGEINIVAQPLDSLFDVRISDGVNKKDQATFHTKRQILADSCMWFPRVSIDIKCLNWPVTMHWDSALFSDICREGSLISSEHPGGWWDVSGSPSDLWRVILGQKNQVTFSSNYSPTTGFDGGYAYTNSSMDTLHVFTMAFGDKSLLSLAVEPISFEVNSYPNPVRDFYYLDIQEEMIHQLHVTDLSGRIQKVAFLHGSIDLSHLQPGIYLLSVQDSEGRIMKKKIVKE